MTIEEIKNFLTTIVEKEKNSTHQKRTEDFDPQDFYGNHSDDCFEGGYDMGYAEGEADLAEQLLKMLPLGL